MNGSFRIGNLFGIPFYINISWFFVLALVTFNYGIGLAFQFPWLGNGVSIALGFVAALLLFSSVLLHELGHSFAAKQQGINVHSITLFLFGGMARLERESDTPTGAFGVAIAGPLVSVGIFALLTAINVTLPLVGPLAAILTLLAYINLALALFNLIPGLPLDGGNVLKAVVWKLTGNRYTGTRVAGWLGQGIGWLAIGFGFLSILGLTNGGSFWTILIGWFLLQNAGRAAQSAAFEERIGELTVADAVTVESPIVFADLTLREFSDQVVLTTSGSWRRFLVKDVDGTLVGTITLDDLKTVPTSEWSNYSVRHLTKPVSQDIMVTSDLPLLAALEKLEERRASSLTVIRENGAVVGLLEKISVLRLLQGRSEVQIAQ